MTLLFKLRNRRLALSFGCLLVLCCCAAVVLAGQPTVITEPLTLNVAEMPTLRLRIPPQTVLWFMFGQTPGTITLLPEKIPDGMSAIDFMKLGAPVGYERTNGTVHILRNPTMLAPRKDAKPIVNPAVRRSVRGSAVTAGLF